MLTVYKYPFPIDNVVDVEMPAHAKVLTIAEQHGQPWLWALVDTDAPVQRRRFHVRGTGHNADGLRSLLHVATFQTMGGALVWHVFEA